MADADVFGRALLAWARGSKSPEIVERDDGFTEPSAGPSVYLSSFRGWPSAERSSLRYARGSVLDVGCGAGRLSLHLQRRGMDVVGLDHSTRAVQAAKLLGVKEVVQGSLESVAKRIVKLDTLVMFGNNFGIFGTMESAQRHLQIWAQRARPGTRLLLESTSPYFGGAPSMDRAYCARNVARGLPAGQARFRYHYDHYVGEWFDWLFVTKGEMRSVVRSTGWSIIDIVGSERSQPYVAVLEVTKSVPNDQSRGMTSNDQ
jgi:SAM-dependent methyltransferase